MNRDRDRDGGCGWGTVAHGCACFFLFVVLILSIVNVVELQNVKSDVALITPAPTEAPGLGAVGGLSARPAANPYGVRQAGKQAVAVGAAKHSPLSQQEAAAEEIPVLLEPEAKSANKIAGQKSLAERAREKRTNL